MANGESAGRFYTREGVPAYNTDLRTARKEGYGVSVTTIAKQWRKDGLDRWIQISSFPMSFGLSWMGKYRRSVVA